MASISVISASKLGSLLAAADPHKTLRVRVVDDQHLSLETDTFQQISVIDLANEKIVSGGISVEAPIRLPKVARKSGKYQLTAFGKTTEIHSLKDLLKAGLIALEKQYPGTLDKLAKIKTTTKRIVARNPADLFDTPGLSEEYGMKLNDNWWYGTNNSKQETNAWLKRACECAGIEWGKNFSTNL